MEKEHQTIHGEQGQQVPFLASDSNGEPLPKEQHGNEKSQTGPQGIKNQVVDICGPAGEKLQYLNGQGGAEPSQEGVTEIPSCAPASP